MSTTEEHVAAPPTPPAAPPAPPVAPLARPASAPAAARKPPARSTFPIGSVLAVIVLAVVAVGGFELYARWMESAYVRTLAPEEFTQKNQGIALQRAAFNTADLLPIYGSSELGIPDPYHASTLFKDYPTGFTIFPINKAGVSTILIQQRLAAVGSELRGKKVVISLSPGWFSERNQIDSGTYAGNFSRLDANELIWSTDLSLSLKQAAARRMLDYPSTLDSDSMLAFGVHELADGSPASLALYYAALPLGKMQSFVLDLQDHWETLAFLRAQPGLTSIVAREPQTLDWTTLKAQALQAYIQHANNNPFGIENTFWTANAALLQKQKGARGDAAFLKIVQTGKEWTDLDLLMRTLKELGAEPLLLSQPIEGNYFDYWGVSPQARAVYYQKLDQVVKAYGMPLLQFADHDEDKYFERNFQSHLGSEGWVYFDEALDNFYHGKLH